MSAKRSQSKHKNFTTTIRRQTSPQPQSTSSAHFTSTIGSRVARGRVTSRPSSVHLAPSASASPAPSSISTYSQDGNPPPIQWDLPTDCQAGISSAVPPGKKTRAKVHVLVLLLSVFFAHFLFLRGRTK